MEFAKFVYLIDGFYQSNAKFSCFNLILQLVFDPCLTVFEVFFIGDSYVYVRTLGRMRPGEADGHYKIYSIISNEIRLLL